MTRAAEYTANFERWWKLYPAARRKDKVKCFGLWQKRSLEGRAAEIIEKLEADLQFDEQWKKGYVPLSHTYLNGGRYDDDKPRRPRFQAPPAAQQGVPAPDLSWQEAMLNRIGLAYLRTASGLPDVKALIAIKREMMQRDAPALDEDIAAAGDNKAERQRVLAAGANTLAELFLSRLDHAYGLHLRHRVLRLARRPA